jgi:PKD repeat protein
MHPFVRGGRLLSLVGVIACLGAVSVSAATYLPGPDTDLARRAPVIVRATVVSQAARLERVDGQLRPFTIVTLAAFETIKGRVPEAFSVRLPGGRVGDFVSWTPGTPRFSAGSEVVLFLEGAPSHPGLYRLTEFGMSKFDLVADEEGRRFAVRPAFGARADIRAAGRADVAGGLAEKAAIPARNAESFLSSLRAVARGERADEPVWDVPSSREGTGQRRPKWVNIGGQEIAGQQPTDLFRWFWDTGDSPNAVVTVTGTQSNLTSDDAEGCGTDSLCDVEHAIDEWHGVADTDVRYSGPAAGGTVTVTLDALQDFNGGSAWTTALGCGGGVIGLGGPGEAFGPHAYRGDGNYYAASIGQVSMRKVTCAMGYSARTFKTAVMHELGHTLGLGHPDDDGTGTPVASRHSTTSPSAWDNAVMTSAVPPSKPETPQTDDIQAIQYYYTTGPVGTLPVANFTFAPGSPTSGSPVSFTDTTTGSPISWSWNFGDAASGPGNTSNQKSPSHIFSAAGTYTVSLSAASATGTAATTKTVTVGQGTGGCVPSATTLCLNGNRFSVTATYRTNDGRNGPATGTKLTDDSGYFYFFNSANIEVVVKVLNGCAVTTHYWVFAAGLTNVEVTLTVTDTRNGTLKNYHSPLGTPFAPVQDTSAFATCP